MFDAGWWAERARYADPGRFDARVRRLFLALLAPVLRLMFRPRIEGLEHLSPDRPALLVANHSGGMAVAELACLAMLYFERFSEVRIAGMAHPLSFHLWPLTWIMRWTGAIPSSYEAAQSALQAGATVLVFPGGDYEAARPFWRAREVDFNRRQGFLRIAQAAGVPIVPMGIAGSHNTAPILWRSDVVLPWLLVLPRLLGLRRFPVSLLGALGALAICLTVSGWLGWPIAAALSLAWLSSPLTFLPYVPLSIRFRIGAPISAAELFADPEDLDAAYDRVLEDIRDLAFGPRPGA